MLRLVKVAVPAWPGDRPVRFGHEGAPGAVERARAGTGAIVGTGQCQG